MEGVCPNWAGSFAASPEVVVTAPLPPGISIQTVTITGPVYLTDPNAIVAPILAAIAASTATTGAKMTQLDDKITEIQAAEAGQTADLLRLITDFENAGQLTQAQSDALDAVKQHLVDNQAAIDAVDPNAPVA